MILKLHRHYQNAWEGLLEMFGSASLLAPRTKRWAEAKVLIDCISFKVNSRIYDHVYEIRSCIFRLSSFICIEANIPALWHTSRHILQDLSTLALDGRLDQIRGSSGVRSLDGISHLIFFPLILSSHRSLCR